MKILLATQHRNIVGGIETYLHTLIPALLERGHQVGMLYNHASTAAATVEPCESELPIWYCDQLQQSSGAWRDLDGWGPDVVYSHGLTAPDVDQILQENYPTVLYMHGYWGTCTTGRKCHAFPRMQPCQRTFGPACLLLHYPRRCGGLNPVSAWKMFQAERVRNSRLAGYRAILVASTHMYSELQRHVSTHTLNLVPLPLTGVPGSTPAIRKTPRGRLLFVGRLTDLKGADFLIRAIPLAERQLGQRLPLTVAGDGAELPKLQRLSERAGVDAVFTGPVDISRRQDLMRAADLLVVPSLWPEPFGLVGIEAGSVGLPAVGYAVGGIPDWLIPGVTGELAPGDLPTPAGLAAAIVRALSNPEHYERLCRGALETARRFTLEAHLATLEPILSACSKGLSKPWLEAVRT